MWLSFCYAFEVNFEEGDNSTKTHYISSHGKSTLLIVDINAGLPHSFWLYLPLMPYLPSQWLSVWKKKQLWASDKRKGCAHSYTLFCKMLFSVIGWNVLSAKHDVNSSVNFLDWVHLTFCSLPNLSRLLFLTLYFYITLIKLVVS